MQALEQLKTHFQAYVWKHVLSMLVGLMLLRGSKTLTALQPNSLPHDEPLPLAAGGADLYPPPTDLPSLAETLPEAAGAKAHGLSPHRRHGPAQAWGEAAPPRLPLRSQSRPGGPRLGLGLRRSAGGFVHCSMGLALLCQRTLLQRGLPQADRAGSRAFVPSLESRVIVLVDSTYCCAEVIRAAHQRGFIFGLGEEEPAPA
jgi:hypothetical protein